MIDVTLCKFPNQCEQKADIAISASSCLAFLTTLKLGLLLFDLPGNCKSNLKSLFGIIMVQPIVDALHWPISGVKQYSLAESLLSLPSPTSVFNCSAYWPSLHKAKPFAVFSNHLPSILTLSPTCYMTIHASTCTCLAVLATLSVFRQVVRAL
eukprot:1434291-Amphidinium_carterae.2